MDYNYRKSRIRAVSPIKLEFLYGTSILKAPIQPFFKLVKRDLTTLAHVPFFTSLIIPQTEFIGLYCSRSLTGIVSLIVLSENADSFIVPELFFIFLLSRDLLTGLSIALTNAVTVFSVVVTLDNKVIISKIL